MNASQLGMFIALAEHLNFSQTAESLFVSQSHVSKQIARLEEEWGIQLFRRDHHSVVLTSAGKVMYDYALQNQRQLTAALRRAKALDDASGLQLRLGVLSQINFRQAPDVIRTIRAANPSARITMEFDGEEPLMTELWEGSYDLIVTNRDAITHWPSMTYCELWRGTYHLSISAEVPAPAEFRELDWLEDQSLITVADDTTVSVRVLLDKLRMKYQFVPKSRLEAPNQEALYRMVESGMGYAFVESVPQNIPPQPQLHFLDTGIPYSCGMAWKSDTPNALVPQFVRAVSANDALPLFAPQGPGFPEKQKP